MIPHKILLLEDCVLLRDCYKESIEDRFENQVQVVTGKNGADGLALITAQYFSCIITDLDMPMLNGLEFIDRARGVYKNTSPIMLHTSGLLPEIDDKIIDYSPLFLELKHNNFDYLYNFINRCIE
jgi:CheY-like chemotaxis protein